VVLGCCVCHLVLSNFDESVWRMVLVGVSYRMCSFSFPENVIDSPGVPVLKIPGYAFFKLYSSFIGPILAGRLSSSSDTQSGSADGDDDTLSKRQAKMKKRSEKGEQVKVKRR
jgi:hypothetical protein